jgi:hypothetical protein
LTTTFVNVRSSTPSMLVAIPSAAIEKLCVVEESWIMKLYVPAGIVVTAFDPHGSVEQSWIWPLSPLPEM